MELPPDIKQEQKEKQKIVGASRIDQEEWRKKNVGETLEKLDEIGTPDEKKGIAATQKYYKEYQKEEFAKKTGRIEWLNKKSKFTKDRKIDYYVAVQALVEYELSFLERPPGYSVESTVTDKGIKLTLKDRFGGVHIGGFTPSGLGLYDEQACRTSVNKIDDMINKLESQPYNGIYLP